VALRTVHVPVDVEEAFRAAEEVVSRYFKETRSDPSLGSIEISGERYVLVRAASLSVEFFSLVEELYGEGRERDADEFARNILYDLAHAIGKSDAQNFHARMGLVDPIARMSAGPIHFSHTGWAFVDIRPESRPSPTDDFFLLYDHPYSFESDAWVRSGRGRDAPVCIMNAGYSSGWCEASFGLVLVATEVECRACGDEHCRFVMAPPHRIETYLEKYRPPDRPRGHAPVTTIPDFFARKRIEEELRRARDELEVRVEERASELREANERLRREMAERVRIEQQLRQGHKLEAIGRLAGGVAHDFNTLLGVIMGNAGMLARQLGQDDPSRPLLDAIIAASGQAAGLTKQLLAFSRTGARGGDVPDVNGLVHELTRLLGRVIGEHIELRTDLGDEVGGALVDRVYLEQIVMNLVVNARDAMPSGGRLEIKTRVVSVDVDLAGELGGVETGAYVAVTVSDTGAGMSEDVAAHIFEPYFTTKESSSGTGLGLSTVYGIVKGAGGGILVHTRPGGGSAFAVHIPCMPLSARDRAVDPGARRRGGAETVLLVEADAGLRTSSAAALRQTGCQVLEASGPAQALELAAASARSISLLVAGVTMTDMSGPRLALRLLAARPTLKILYTADARETGAPPDRPDVGGASVLAKPFTSAALLAKVRAALDEE
jgi:two-component system, cell cycle sensor histidine kinase and response regulator CckA